MNRNQYFAISWFCLILMFLLIAYHTFIWQGIYASSSFSSNDLSVGATYVTIKFAIFSVIITLLFPLFILFRILGWLEPKKK